MWSRPSTSAARPHLPTRFPFLTKKLSASVCIYGCSASSLIRPAHSENTRSLSRRYSTLLVHQTYRPLYCRDRQDRRAWPATETRHHRTIASEQSGHDVESVEGSDLHRTRVSEEHVVEQVEQEDLDEDDPDPQDDQEYHYNSGENTFNFHELADAIEQHLNTSEVQQMNKTPPSINIFARKDYNRPQREIWETLRAKVVADEKIPVALFNPPRTYIQVRFATWPRKGEHFCCPCDLPKDSLPFIEIRAERGSECGITKEIFVEQVAEGLYGAKDGSGWTIGDRNSRPVIDHFDWMIDGGIIGHIYAMTRGFVE